MIIPWARKYIGIPFVSCGRDSNGCDCYGLLYIIAKNELKIELPRLDTDYTNANNVLQTKDLFIKNIPNILSKKIECKIGDVCLINCRGYATHIGLYVGDGYILTTTHKTDSCLQRVSDLQNKVEGFYSVTHNS